MEYIVLKSWLKKQEITGNYQAILDDLGAKHLLILQQEHGAKVCDADALIDFSSLHKADAAITTKCNIVLAIQLADCIPVLLASNDGKVIAAAHCGWKSVKASSPDRRSGINLLSTLRN